MIEISVVSPVYNSATLVGSFTQRVSAVLQQLGVPYEIVLVDDGSADLSWREIEAVCALDQHIKGILLSRNFGQHYAITAGLDIAQGNWVIVMDSDLQDRPEEIPLMYKKAQEGFEIVLCRRNQRTDGWLKKLGSQFFNSFLNFITGKKIDHTIANYGIYKQPVIKSIIAMRESIRYFPMMVLWVGYKSTTIEVLHGQRLSGKTTYNFKKLVRLALDIVLSYSDKPLEIVALMGGIISLASFCFGIITLIRYFNHSIVVLGYTSLLLSIWFLSGLIMATLGIVGLYVGKTFNSIKQRPLYITRTTLNVAN